MTLPGGNHAEFSRKRQDPVRLQCCTAAIVIVAWAEGRRVVEYVRSRVSGFRKETGTVEDAKDEFHVMGRLQALSGLGSSLCQMEQRTFRSLAARWSMYSRGLSVARFSGSPQLVFLGMKQAAVY